MLKVFTSVFVVESLSETCDEVEAALKREGVDVAFPAATGRRRHVVELQVKVEAPLGWSNEGSGR